MLATTTRPTLRITRQAFAPVPNCTRCDAPLTDGASRVTRVNGATPRWPVIDWLCTACTAGVWHAPGVLH
jgi:RNase P subunit RPR2